MTENQYQDVADRIIDEFKRVLTDGGESAWNMARRFMTEDEILQAGGADYPSFTDYIGSANRFVEAWKGNDSYEILLTDYFEGEAQIATRPRDDSDSVKVVLYGVDGMESADMLKHYYPSYLRYIADWIEKNAETVVKRCSGDIGISHEA